MYSSMRVRDLQRLLIKLGFVEKEVMSMLDKREIIDLIEDYDRHKIHADFVSKFLIFVVGCCSIYYCYIIYQYIFLNMEPLWSWLEDWFYPFQLRIKFIRKSLKRRNILATFLLSCCLILDLYQSHIQMSTIAGWILPRSSYLRNFFAHTVSIPVYPSMFMKKQSDDVYMNVGPMITVGIIKFLKTKLENISASYFMKSHKVKDT